MSVLINEMEVRRKIRASIIKLIKFSEESEKKTVTKESIKDTVEDLEELARFLKKF